MPKYQIWNHAYNIVCIVTAVFAALPPSVINVLPVQVKPYIVGAAGMALWLKSNWNLFVNPNGTDARTAYIIASGSKPAYSKTQDK